MINKRNSNHHKDRGFTIIELMIATSVFAVIMLILTFGILQLSNYYSLGVLRSATQDTDRNVVSTIAQGIKLSNGNICINWVVAGGGTSCTWSGGDTEGVFCIGDQVFGFTLFTQPNLTNSGLLGPLGLIEYPNSGSSCPNFSSLNSLTNGQQLLASNMMLTKMMITQVGSSAQTTYQVDAKVMYSNITNNNVCPTYSNPSNNSPPACPGGNGSIVDYTCMPSSSARYCDIAELTTTVQPRLGLQSLN